MGISLSLAQLKEYFEIWHTNNFNSLHSAKLDAYINNYLSKNQISSKINSISELETTILNIGKFLSQSIDGDSSLSNSSSLSEIINELSTKNNINLSNTNLKELSDAINTHATNIDTLTNDKADTSWVTGQLNAISASLGVTPTTIATQKIPAQDMGRDLNNYRTTGLYRSATSANTQSLSHVPTGAQNSAFNLIVLQHMDKGFKQILSTAEKTNTGNRMYVRNYDNNWGEWYELYGTHNTTQLQMKVEFSDGSNTTYTLLQK